MVEVNFGKLKEQNKSMPEGIIPPVNRLSSVAKQAFTAVQLYAVVTIDLTNARASPTPLGAITLPDGTPVPNWVANSFAVTAFPSGAVLSIGLGDPKTTPIAAGMMTASSTLSGQGMPFTQMYFTNTAQPGVSVELVLAWVD